MASSRLHVHGVEVVPPRLQQWDQHAQRLLRDLVRGRRKEAGPARSFLLRIGERDLDRRQPATKLVGREVRDEPCSVLFVDDPREIQHYPTLGV